MQAVNENALKRVKATRTPAKSLREPPPCVCVCLLICIWCTLRVSPQNADCHTKQRGESSIFVVPAERFPIIPFTPNPLPSPVPSPRFLPQNFLYLLDAFRISFRGYWRRRLYWQDLASRSGECRSISLITAAFNYAQMPNGGLCRCVSLNEGQPWRGMEAKRRCAFAIFFAGFYTLSTHFPFEWAWQYSGTTNDVCPWKLDPWAELVLPRHRRHAATDIVA